MRDLCRRTPRGLRRLVEGHRGEAGIIVYGWFKRLIYWPEVRGWPVVTISVDGERLAMLDEVRRKPVWIPLMAGEHVVDFDGLNGRLHKQRIQLVPGEIRLIVFRPPLWLPLRRSTPARWCSRRVSADLA